MKQGLEHGQQRVGNDFGALRGWMNPVGLNGTGHVDEVFVDHGNKRGMVFRGKCFENLVELLNVIRAVVWRQRDAGQQDFDMRRFE